MLHLLKRHLFPVKAFFTHSLVLTYAYPEELLKPLLAPGLTLDTYKGLGFLAIALVQTRSLRPAFFPEALGQDFFLSGYRLFARYTSDNGINMRGLRILRSDTDRRTMSVLGNLFTHYAYRMADVRFDQVGDKLNAKVDAELRAKTVRNHSATHLMHKALREVLGDHVAQKGSQVTPDRTRFDFSHGQPLSDEEIREIEALVNAEVLANAEAQAQVMALDDAQKSGAMMLFGEKYGETVRVLSIGSSKELCGGTHVQRTGDIGLFKIVAESGVAAGVRRVEAITGANALSYTQNLEGTLKGVAALLKATPHDVPARVAAAQDQIRALEKEIASLKGKLASSQGDELVAQAADIKGVKVLAATLEGADAATLRNTMDQLKNKLKTAAIVLAAVDGGKVQLAAGVTADTTSKVKAGELVNFVAQQVGGKGGGKPDMAMAGGTDAAALPQALAGVQAWVAERL